MSIDGLTLMLFHIRKRCYFCLTEVHFSGGIQIFFIIYSKNIFHFLQQVLHSKNSLCVCVCVCVGGGGGGVDFYLVSYQETLLLLTKVHFSGGIQIFFIIYSKNIFHYLQQVLHSKNSVCVCVCWGGGGGEG